MIKNVFCRQVLSSTITSTTSFIFVLSTMFLFGAFFVSAAENGVENTAYVTSVTLIASSTATSSTVIDTTPIKISEAEVRANRLYTILSGLDGISTNQLQSTSLKEEKAKNLAAKKRSFELLSPQISALKERRKSNQGTDDIKNMALQEFEDLRKINAGLKAAVSQKIDQSVNDPSVVAIEPSYLMTLQDVYIPNDPRLNEQWYISRILETTKNLWFLPSKNQNPPIIAVIDAGIDFTHEDLSQTKWKSDKCFNERGEEIGTCVGGYDFVDNDNDPRPSDDATHGTAVASLIAASTDNEIGIASLSRGNAQLMSLRVAQHGVLETDNIIRAILFAVHNGAKVINMSFAGPTYSRQLEEAILYAQDHGVIMSAAAGNAGINLDVTPVYPASFSALMLVTVGAIDETGKVTAWSNYGKAVDVFSPGARILASSNNNSYTLVYGTSFSAPIIASYLSTKMEQGVSYDTALKELPKVPSFRKISADGTVLGIGRFLLGKKQSADEIMVAPQQDASGRWFNPQSKAGEYITDPKKFTTQAINYSLGLPQMLAPGNVTQPGPSISSSGSVTFSWTSVSGVASYGVYVRDLTTNTLIVDCMKCTTGTSKSFSGFVTGRQYRWNMNSWDAAGNNSSAYTTPFYFVIPVLLAAPAALSPGSTSATGPEFTSTTQTLSWSAVTGATGYYVEFTNTSTGVVENYAVSGTSKSVSTPEGKNFKWRVRTKNSVGQYGNYSPYYYFKIKAPNTAPAVPSVAGSGAVVVNNNYVIGFATSDAQNDQVKFDVQWDANNSSAYSTYGYYAVGERSGNASRAYATAGTYCIKVRAIDLPGATSAYSACHNVTVAAAALTPTLTVTPATQTVTSGTNANFTVSTTNVANCTISGNGLVNSPLSNVNATYSIGPLSISATYTITCTGTSGASISKNFTVNVGAATASPAVTFSTIPNLVNGTAFTLAFTATNIPVGSVITLTPSMGNISPSTITLSGSSYSGSVVIKSATGGVTLAAKYNGSTVGTSNSFTVSNGTTCSASQSSLGKGIIVNGTTIPVASSSVTISTEDVNSKGTFEQSGLCAPANPNLAEPYLITPGTQTSPGTQYSTSTLSFSITPVTGAVSYEIYLRHIASNALYTFPVTSTIVNVSGLGTNNQWRWNAAAKGSDGRLGWVTDVNYFTIAPSSTNPPTFTLTPTTQTIASLGTASLVLTTTNVSSCTLSGGGFSNYSWGPMVNGTLNISNISASVTYSITCLGQNGTSITRTSDVVVSATAPKATFSTIGSQVTGTVFPVTITTANIPSGAVLALSSSMGTIYPSSITLSGTSWSGNVYITSATGNINIKARYNGTLVGTSNTFAITSPSSCLADAELNGLCVPPSPNTPPPPNLTPGTVTSPGPEVASISQTFTWTAVPGSTRYAFYLRDLDTNDLIISTENVLTNSYTYNYLGTGKKYKWNVVAFDSTGKGGWSADPVYFTVKAGLAQPTRTVSSLTQDELSLCPEGQSCTGYTYQVIGIDSGTTLQSSFSEFNEGVEDEIYIAGGGVVIGKVAVTSAKQLTPLITPLIEKAAGTKIGAMVLGSKFVPYLGQAIVVGGVGVAMADSANLLANCAKPSGTISTDLLFGWEKPSWYFCGRSAVRVPVVVATLVPLSNQSATKVATYLEAKTIFSKIENVTLSVRATEVFNDPSRTVPVSILKEAIKVFDRLPDPQLSSAYMYYSKIYINGKYYNLEVLYDTATNQIWHFKYTSQAIGTLPAI